MRNQKIYLQVNTLLVHRRTLVLFCTLFGFLSSNSQSSNYFKISHLHDSFQEKLIDSLGVVKIEIHSNSWATEEWMKPLKELKTVESQDNWTTTVFKHFNFPDSSNHLYKTITLEVNNKGDMVYLKEETDRTKEYLYTYKYDNKNRIVKEILKEKKGSKKPKKRVVTKYLYSDYSDYNMIRRKMNYHGRKKWKQRTDYQSEYYQNHFSKDSLLLKKTYRKDHFVYTNYCSYDSSGTILQRESWYSYAGQAPHLDSVFHYNTQGEIIRSLYNFSDCNSRITNYFYNDTGQLVREEQIQNINPSNVNVNLTYYTYSSEGLITRVKFVIDYGTGQKTTEYNITYEFKSSP